MSQSIILTFSSTTPKEIYLSMIALFHEGYIFRFDSTIDLATVINRLERYIKDSDVFSSAVCLYCSPGTELYAAYGAGTIVVISVVAKVS